MITTPTVFIVGAGASSPLLPTGEQLLERAFGDPKDRAAFSQLLESEDAERVRDFIAGLRESRCSLDAFIERQPEPDRLIGRQIIVALLASELYSAHYGAMHPDSQSCTPRWLVEVFRRMLSGTGSIAEFMRNEAYFITFNFDNLIEHVLYGAARAVWGKQAKGSQLDDISMWVATERVTHVHGIIRTPDTPAEMDLAWIRKQGEALHILHSEMPADDRQRIIDWLRKSRVVCFLGFGFDPLNLAKLPFTELADNTRRSFFATTQGLAVSDVVRLQQQFEGIDLAALDCASVLHNRHVFID